MASKPILSGFFSIQEKSRSFEIKTAFFIIKFETPSTTPATGIFSTPNNFENSE